MIFNKCSECSTEFLAKRSACPNCGSGNISKVDINEGKAVESVHLIATPHPFPDEYSIILFETPGGARGFCRTTDDVAFGEPVVVSLDEHGPVCKKL